jgi:uncharacterized membrane protein YfbV (UPF0208 family)
MQAALAAEPALGADETPVNVLTPDEGPETGEPDGGSPHVLIIRPPGEKLTWLLALGSRRAAAITAILGFFTGFLITDGYTAYQQMLLKLAGIQQCAAHVVRRCRAVTKLGPGSLQSWANDVIETLREAHEATEEARARGEPAADAELLAKLRQRYDQATAFGITHNRHRDWHDGNHPGYALGCWLRDYAGQVWLFTREPAVDWTNDLASHCTSWGCCEVFGWGARWGWLADVILAWGGDILGGSAGGRRRGAGCGGLTGGGRRAAGRLA